MKILLVGTSGYNLGDDALAAVLVTTLVKIYPGAEVTVTSVNPGRLSAQGIEEFAVKRRSLRGWIDLIARIRQSDLILLGGGTLIQDALGVSLLRGMIPYIWQITWLAKIMGKPLATVPIGVDELNHSKSEKWARDIFNRCRMILLRDAKSFSLVQKNINPNDYGKLVLSADPVFAMNEPAGQPDISGKYIVLSYVKEKREKAEVVAEVNDILATFRLQRPDHKLVLLSMDTREEDELGVYNEVIAGPVNSDVILRSPSDFREALSIIRNADVVVAMRLHAMILGLGYVPIVGISRTTKTDTLMREAKIYGFKVHEFKSNNLANLVDRAINDRDLILLQKEFVASAVTRFSDAMRKLINL